MNTNAEKNIYKAFLELYLQKNLNEISVKEICLKANISRMTFYTYFEDIRHLLNEIEEKIITDVIAIFKTWPYIDLNNLDKNKPISMLVDYYTYVNNNRGMLWAIYTRSSDSHFFDRFNSYGRKYFMDAVKLSKITVYTPETLTAICIDGLESMEKLWLSGKIKATPVEFALLVQRIYIAIINYGN
jgi:AcrR family transcriptional regulator